MSALSLEMADDSVSRRAIIAGENPTIGIELLQNEIGKLDRRVDSFIDLAATAARYSEYLERPDIGSIDRLANSYALAAPSAQGTARPRGQEKLASSTSPHALTGAGGVFGVPG